MATYTQGYQPYMPDWQPFTPDYKFLSDILEVKTNRYNTNYKALNDLYSKVVYSDLSRKDTQDMRNQYVETLGKQLEMVSGMDLSVAQNVDSAKQLFKPFYEEDLIVKDLVFTKNYQNEMQYANMLMNSPDKDQREMYWQTGVKALEYQMEDFKNASSDKALTMGTPRYTPDADLNEKAIEYLKKQGLDVTQEYVDETGYWIVKDRNGNLVTQQAYTMAQKALMDDPMVQQAYYTDAYVRSRDFAKNGIDAGRFTSVDEGQAAWAQETISRVEAQIAARSVKEKDKVDELKNANVNWDEYAKDSGLIPGSDEAKEYENQKRSYDAALNQLKITQETLQNSQGSPDQSTQGLLNRAYNLLMGYNLQTDLGAAAVAFSNINKSRELKVNDYKKQQLEFQHDFSVMSAKFQYDLALEDVKQKNRIELEKEKYKINNPYANLFNSIFSGQPSFDKKGTEEALIDPNTGKPVQPEDADYVKIINDKYEILRADVTEEQVGAALNALEKIQPNANNYYTVNEKIKGTLPQIKAELLKPENAGIADDFYKKMANVVRDSDELMRTNPTFVKRNNGGDYQELYSDFEKVTAKRMQFDNAISQGNQVYYDNFMKVIKTDLTKETKQVRSDLDNGMPTIFENNSKGAMTVKSKEEFVSDFVALAKEKKIKGTDNNSVGWRYESPEEHDRYTAGMMIGGLGPSPAYLTQRAQSRPAQAGWKFNENAARVAATEAFDRQKLLINNTLNGTLETVAEQEGLKKGGSPRMFQPWDPYQYMRGRDLSQMEIGDALKNPYYTTQIDPISMQKDINQLTTLKTLVDQVNKTPLQELSFHKGDIADESTGWFGDAKGILNSNDPKARQLYDAWIQDLSRFRDPKASKTNLPQATVSYAPGYGPTDEDALGKSHAAYVVTFSPEWIKGVEGNGKGPIKELSEYQTITITFPQERDLNPKKVGEYNFSATRNEVMYSPNKQVVHNIEGGGKFRVYQDQNSNFVGEIVPLQYNPQTGNFDTLAAERVNLSQMMEERNETVGYIDNLVTSYVNTLYQVAQQNNRDQANNKKSKAKK